MRFIDHHPYLGQTYYPATNEEPDLHEALLQGAKLDRLERAASICSGGELPLLTLLPRVEKELVAIDHNYSALALTWLKAEALLSPGPEALLEYIVENDYDRFWKALSQHANKLPPELKKAMRSLDRYSFAEIRRVWAYIPLDTFQRAISKLDKLTLIHGDLTDLKDYGVFTLLYLSNAHRHTSRTGQQPNLSNLIKPNTFVLWTNYDGEDLPAQIKPVARRVGIRSTWNHHLSVA